MAKRKRGRAETCKTKSIQRRRTYVTNLGLPEIDRLINCVRFKHGIYSNKPLRNSFASSTTPIQNNVVNRLPDEILHFIISKLSTREGAATCILSKRWRTLWNSSASCLDFDIPTMLGHNYPKDLFRGNNTHSSEPSLLLKKKRYEFIEWVDRVWHQRSASRLDSLRVCFVLDKRSASEIDRWINSAVAQGVSDIELDFNTFHFNRCLWSTDPSDYYEFTPCENAPSLKHLRLQYCIFHLPCHFTGFTSLVSLCLSFTYVTQQLVDNILSNCPLLECLSPVNCSFYDTTTLTFTGPSLQLKHLNMNGYCVVKKIEVHNINLISLEIGFRLPTLSIKNAPRLVRLLSLMHIEVLSNVPHLEILFLQQQYEVIPLLMGWRSKSIIPPSCVFSNLKRLVFLNERVETSFLEVLRILETCPSLQELELNMICIGTFKEELTETISKLTAVPRIHHNNLKEVEIHGFEDRPEKIVFAKYLLSYAVVLEKMKICTTTKVYHGNGIWILHKGSANQEKSLKEVQKHLRNLVRPSTKLELSSSLDL